MLQEMRTGTVIVVWVIRHVRCTAGGVNDATHGVSVRDFFVAHCAVVHHGHQKSHASRKLRPVNQQPVEDLSHTKRAQMVPDIGEAVDQ